jgi:hypothetical protein
MKRRLVLAATATAAALLLACETQPAKITIISGVEGFTFSDHQERVLRVEVFDALGNEIERPELSWSSITPRIARVTPDGVIEPGDDGRTRIVVRSGYVEQQIPVNVQIHAGIEVKPSEVAVDTGEVRSLGARVLDRRGKTIEDAAISWSIVGPKFAEVDDRGTISGIAPGNTTLIVRSAGAAIELPVEVRPPFDDAS